MSASQLRRNTATESEQSCQSGMASDEAKRPTLYDMSLTVLCPSEAPCTSGPLPPSGNCTYSLRKKTEEELQARKEIEERNYMAAKYKLKEYLDSLNATQSRLISTYNELGKLVNQMPIRLEDVFSEEPMELLENQSAVKKKKIDISISEAGEE